MEIRRLEGVVGQALILGYQLDRTDLTYTQIQNGINA